MQATGIVRKLDELGRIVLPIELRRSLEWGEKEPIEIFVEGDTVLLRKYKPRNEVEEELIFGLKELSRELSDEDKVLINKVCDLLKSK